MVHKHPQRENHADLFLGLLTTFLTIFGVIMVYNVSVVVAFEEFHDKLWFLKNQGLWAIIGLIAAFICSKIDYHWWRKLALPLLILSIFGLVLVFMPNLSIETYGARRRLAIPLGIPFLSHLNLQPSELAKLSLVLYLATLFSREEKKGVPKRKWGVKPSLSYLSSLTPFLTILSILVILVALEPDLGTTIIIAAVALWVYFLAGATLAEIGLIAALLSTGGLAFSLTSEYRFNRLKAFINPATDQLGISYHINQILIALGSGGLFGLGLGHSRQKYQYLPEAVTDSIFAIIGEELGLVGTTLVVLTLFFIAWRGLQISQTAQDKFGKLLAGGISGIITIQSMVNLASMVALSPLTGVPLPFISYGGSSLTITLVGIGILLNISKQAKS